eukprot:TRINITY_DN2499_c0_g1_i3.p1 TRINITY_DN2499_c0_g1~~TRINITY_DN2499_c0_g1_i3.p1  ORF type:complete len:275 (+),score=69.80 TRINITY_DN2499_c0_g1_i3:204-1028(+)
MDGLWKQLCCARLPAQEPYSTTTDASKKHAGQAGASAEFKEVVLASSAADSKADLAAPCKDVLGEQAVVDAAVAQTRTSDRTMESKSGQLQGNSDVSSRDAELRTSEADKHASNVAVAGTPLEAENARATETLESESTRFGSEPLPDAIGVLEFNSATDGQKTQKREADGETGANSKEVWEQRALESQEGADAGKRVLKEGAKPDDANMADMTLELQASNDRAKKEENREHDAATAELQASKDVAENREHDAATKIQARARGNSLRSSMINETF